MYPLVSVICTCYNHAAYVQEAMESVLGQTWPAVELIVVDSGSTDASLSVIRAFQQKHPKVKVLEMGRNAGICTAFNRGLALSGGAYVIDLAADDLLLPNRIARQVELLEAKGPAYGVTFSDAWIARPDGRYVRTFYRRDRRGNLLPGQLSEGEVFAGALGGYFICTPTIIMRRELLERLGGYDEALSYEDYDFRVRAARISLFAFQDEVLTVKRNVPGSASWAMYRQRASVHLRSTWQVLQKAVPMCHTPAERAALIRSARYHLRQCALTGCPAEAPLFATLLREAGSFHTTERIWGWMARRKIPLRAAYYLWLRMRG